MLVRGAIAALMSRTINARAIGTCTNLDVITCSRASKEHHGRFGLSPTPTGKAITFGLGAAV